MTTPTINRMKTHVPGVRSPATPFFLAVAFALFVAAPGVAQQAPAGAPDAILSEAMLDAAAANHETRAQEGRSALAELLSLPEVQELARDRGISMERVEGAAASLSDDEVAELEPLLDEVAAAMRRDRTITISVTTIIIILLLLILLT